MRARGPPCAGVRHRPGERPGVLEEGEPVVVLEKGKFDAAQMNAERLTKDEVVAAARAQGIADMKDVRLCVLEADGKLSFITLDGEPRQQKRKQLETEK